MNVGDWLSVCWQMGSSAQSQQNYRYGVTRNQMSIIIESLAWNHDRRIDDNTSPENNCNSLRLDTTA